MSSLVIVESPAKAKTISNFLGKDYKVLASYGHVRDLPAGKKQVPQKYKSEKWADFGVNVEDQFQPIYVMADGKKKYVDQLKKALKESDELLLATDEDREGESISWHLVELLKPKVPVKRIVFHEITRDAIQEALSNPRDLDDDLVHAQESRRILDRLFGYKLSPVLWKKVQPGLSAGRVQSVAVRLIVEREEERCKFKKSQYWDLEARIGENESSAFSATLTSVGGKRVASGRDFDSTTGELKNQKVTLLDEKSSKELADSIARNLPWEVIKVEEKPASQRPYPPFTTSTLQQEGNRKLSYTARRTMQIAQKLYEGIDLGGGERVGLITYMRTDSVVLSDKALKDSQAVIKKMYGDKYATGPRKYKTKQRNAQEAHEAIRPTEVSRTPTDLKNYLTKEELNVYELIWKRTLASQMPDAKLLRTSIEIEAPAQNEGAVFTASGKKILFPGFLRAYVEGSDDPSAELGDKEVLLPDLKVGSKVHDKSADKDEVKLYEVTPKFHETQPPARYTEASLVKKLEEESIGRPSTYASIISTIQDRGYVYMNKSKQLIPTFTALLVTDLLRDHFGKYIDVKFTAKMEEQLDQIAEGDLEWVEHVRDFFRGSNGAGGLETLVEDKEKTIDFPTLSLGSDPESGEDVRVRVGRYGAYLQKGENGNSINANLPQDMPPEDLTLEKALTLLAQKEKGPRVVGEHPDLGEKIYVMIGRYGAYVQIGETPEDKKAPKPKRASLEKNMHPDTITLEESLKLLAFPRELGPHPETGEMVICNKGRFGPYVGHQKDFRSLKKEDDPSTVTLERALELLSQPKGGRGRGAKKTVLKELGKNDKGKEIQVLDGRYGPYVSDGKVNATLPKGSDPKDVTLEKALELIDAKSKQKKSKK